MKKLMICVDLNEESLKDYKEALKNSHWSAYSEVHFVHGFERQVYGDHFYYSSYPTQEQYHDIEESVNGILCGFQDALKESSTLPESLINKCLIVGNPKKALVEYAQKKKLDEILILTRATHGIQSFFSSSFAQYMLQHSHCALRVVRGVH